MKTKKRTNPTAGNHRTDLGLAALGAEITTADDGWYQLFADGLFSAVDGRPDDVPGGKWLMDAAAFALLKAHTQHQISDLVIDYEHQTQRAAENGKPAPAAGFVHLSAMEYRPGAGVFIKPRWTEKAKAMLAAGEYRYLSPVFAYDKASGRPAALMSVGLTNRPGQDGLQPLAALSADFIAQLSATHSATTTTEDTTVNEHVIKILAALGIPVPADGELTAEQGAAALSALQALQTTAAKVDGLETSIAELKARTPDKSTGVDLTQYVPVATYNAMAAQVAALSAQSEQLNVAQVIDKAQAEGRVVAAELAYLKQVGEQHGVAALSAMLEQRPVIGALGATQTQGKPPEGDQLGSAALSAEEREVCRITGKSEKEFAQFKANQ